MWRVLWTRTAGGCSGWKVSAKRARYSSPCWNNLLKAYAHAPVIHVVLDNYRIHDSKIVQAALRWWGGRIRLHFLPPYCPNDNKIERVWQDLHANVTRNHTCRTMTALMREVRYYLRKRNRKMGTRRSNTSRARPAA